MFSYVLVFYSLSNTASFKDLFLAEMRHPFILSYLAFLLISSFQAQAESSQDDFPITKGVLDLTENDLDELELIDLKGEWEFYWQKLLGPQDFAREPESSPDYFNTPGAWNAENDLSNSGVSTSGYATYRLRIKTDKDYGDVGLRLQSRGLSYLVYVNGIIFGRAGKVGMDDISCIPEAKNDIFKVSTSNREIEIIIQSCNFHNNKGGLYGSITLGKYDQLMSARTAKIWIDLFMSGSIFIMAIYHLGLYVLRRKYTSPLYFGLFCFLIFIRTFTTGEYLANILLNVHWIVVKKVDFLSFYLSTGIFALFSYSLFRADFSDKILKIIVGICLTFSTIVVVAPPSFFVKTLSTYQLITLALALYLMYIIAVAVRNKREGALVYLTGWAVLFLMVINDLLYFNNVIQTGSYIHIGLFFFIFSQAFLLSMRYEKSFKRNEELTSKLNFVNRNLENMVDARTASLQEVNLELDTKNKQVTASINYAKRIQKGLLPEESEIKSIFPDSFVLLKPRDIVSGDFYWFSHLEDTYQGKVSVLAVADCTGHGVPGALMSMTGVAFLNQIVNTQRLLSPDLILFELNNTLRNAMNSQSQDVEDRQDDGMDIAVVVIKHEKNELTFSGAKRPLLVHQNGELKMKTGTKLSIGGFQKDEEKVFDLNTINIKKGARVYMFTDGLTDQLGGANGRKFKLAQLQEDLLEIQTLPTSEHGTILNRKIIEWMKEGNEPQTDDMLIVGLKI